MKGLRKVLIGLPALFLLTGCTVNITAEKFQKQMDSFLDHQYSSVYFELRTSMEGTEDYESYTSNSYYEAYYVWNNDSAAWESEKENSDLYKVFLFTIKGKTLNDITSEDDLKQMGLDYSIRYYKEGNYRFGIDIEATGTMDMETANEDVIVKYSYKRYFIRYGFNRFGYLTSYSQRISYDVESYNSSGEKLDDGPHGSLHTNIVILTDYSDDK